MNEADNNTPPVVETPPEVEVQAQAAPAAPAEAEEAVSYVEETPAADEVQPALNVTQESRVYSALPPNYKVTLQVSLPSDTVERTDKKIKSLPNVDHEATEEGKIWSNTLQMAIMSAQWKDGFLPTVEREGSNFHQYVPSERGPLSVGTPKFRDVDGGKWSGEKGVLRVRGLMGMGSIVQVPLWHSGFWITFKAPSEAMLLELHRQLSEEKIKLGRQTYGLAFSNSSSFFSGWLVDFFLNHMYETTLHADLATADQIRKHISVLDLPTLAWGMACCIWPKGFPYARAIIDPKAETQRVLRGMLNVGKIQWIDWSSLTDWQRKHMANKQPGQVTADAIKRYKEDFTRGQARKVVLNENLAVFLKVPSIEEHLVSGQQWINNIVTMVDRAFGMPPNDATRNAYIIDQGRATLMRQYAHWVHAIEAGEGNEIDERETLDAMLDTLSEDEDIARTYREGVINYINDASVTVIAVPATEVGEEGTMPQHPHLLPIDAMSVFFLLLVQKVDQIQNRN